MRAVPIFPLPNVVLFPKTIIPLHIFEERYRIMTREALAGDRRIVIVLLREGWESGYYANPAVHQIACLGRIENFEELEGGKYNLVLEGLQRVRLVRELPGTPYRRANIVPLRELDFDDQAEPVVRRRNHLGGLLTRYTELSTHGRYRAVELVPQLGFEALVNTVATVLNMPAQEKQGLLEINDITQRCDTLIPVLRRQLEVLMVVREFEHLKPEDANLN